MALLSSWFRACVIATVCCVIILAARADATTSTPYKILQNKRNIIVWQRFDPWLIITEDLATGRTCYYYDPAHNTQINLKPASAGTWMPLASAIKWLMYVDYQQGLNRLMAHDVDWHFDHIALTSSQNQVGCGMTGMNCVYGQYRSTRTGDHYPVDLMRYNIETGALVQITTSTSEKSQFAHDGSLIVYRAYNSATDSRVCGEYFAGGPEIEVAARNGIEPSVCGSLVAWAEVSGAGYNIMAKDISTGEMRTVTYTTANPPCPEAGRGAIFWQDARTLATTGIDIYGYDWATQQQFVVTNATGDQTRLRVGDTLVTWVTGATNYQTLWGANIIPPVKVTDLRANLVGLDSAQLAWTSVGSTSNPAVSYDLRERSDGPITDANWSTSTPVPGLPAPHSAGTVETFIVSNLRPGYHHFALKVRLQNGTDSLLSNSVCTYLSGQSTALQASDGSYISVTGVVIGLGPGGLVYCEEPTRSRAVRAVRATGQMTPTIGQMVTVTGVLGQDSDLCGPVLQQAAVGQVVAGAQIKPLAMANKQIGGFDARWGGTSWLYRSNQWMLIKSWGRVSGLVTGSGCSFYIDDGSKRTNGGQAVYVTSPFATPASLANGSYVAVEGISRVSRTSGRQIEVVQDGKIQVVPD